MIVTKNMSANQSWADVLPTDVTPDEKRLIAENSFGYCETHMKLYRKVTQRMLAEEGGGFGLTCCPVSAICCHCDDPTHSPKISDFGPCKEWGEVEA